MKGLRTRLRAWAVHLGISALVMSPVFALIFLAWFPAPWFEVLDVLHIVGVLVGVDLVLGPLLTFIVYRPGKKGLKFDLAVIAVVQVAALVYGVVSIHSERPRWVSFAVDRYTPLAAKDVVFSGVDASRFDPLSLAGPRYVLAEMPTGDAFQQFQESVLFGGQPDLEARPEFWRPLEQAIPAVLAAAEPLSRLRQARPAHDQVLVAKAQALGLDPESTPWVPVMGKGREFVALLDPATAEVMDVVAVDPWLDNP